MKLIHKERIGSRWRRIQDQPQAAYQCLLKTEVLKRQLKSQFESLDCFELNKRLEKSLQPILTNALEVN
jgi:hypothetical protein